MTLPVNSYLQDLYKTYEQEIRGENKPIEDVDHRPNYIGMCMNMMETPQMKIGCLRKLKELTAMNPFYQYRIDRFIDAITDTYEPTSKPGFTEYIRGEKDSALTESEKLSEIDPLQIGVATAVTGSAIALSSLAKRKACKKKYPNEPARQKMCVKLGIGPFSANIKPQSEDKPKKVKESVGNDIFEGATLNEYLGYLTEIDPSVIPAIQKGLAIGGALTVANLTVMGRLKRKKCKQAFPNDPQKYKECMAGVR